MTGKRALASGVTALIDRALCSRGKPLLSILIYHQVLRQPDFMRPDTPTARDFDWQMALLARHFAPLSLNDALHHLDENTLPDRAICVTFDDGYADNLEVALPILNRWKIPATVFVATAFLERGVMWNDRVIDGVKAAPGDVLELEDLGLGRHEIESEVKRRGVSRQLLRLIKPMPPPERDKVVEQLAARCSYREQRLMMDTAQLMHLRDGGVEIGAHTHSHPILASLDAEAARSEIVQGKSILESLLQTPVRLFAYPNGRPGQDYTGEHVDMVTSAGFDAAVSTHMGVASKRSDRWQLPRFTPWDRQPTRFLGRLLLSRRSPQ